MLATITMVIVIGALLIGFVSLTADRPNQREVDFDALGRCEVPAEPVHLPDSRPRNYVGNRRRR